MKIIGLIALYNPTESEFKNVEKYVDSLDYCYLMDDSGKDNKERCVNFIEAHKGKVEYICNEHNLGLTGSMNKGFQLAINNGADWILIMNPDGTFQNDAIGIYRDFLENYKTSKIAILAPIYNFDRHPRTVGKGYKEIKYADMTGCLYNAKILQKTGFYDAKTYFYGLDTEYCLRMNKYGYKIIECSEAVLNHHPAHTEELKLFGKSIFKYGKDAPDRYYYQFRSGYYLHKKYHNIRQDLFMTYKYLKVLFLFDRKSEYLGAIKRAKKDADREYFGKLEV